MSIKGRLKSVLKSGLSACVDEYKQSIVNSLEKKASLIATSNGTQYYQKYSLNVLIITDEYMFDYFDEAVSNLQYIPGDLENFDEIKAGDYDFFIFVSCWFGLENDWFGLGANPVVRAKLEALIISLRSKGLPTVFYSIEDPSNYEKFLMFAKQCDYIFTSDLDIVDRYKEDTENENVSWLEWGINPLRNNPIHCFGDRKNEFFFAGSYARRYAQRVEDMTNTFDLLQKSNQKIFVADRNYGSGKGVYRYPAQFGRFVYPAIEHRLLQRVHKLFKWQLNFNSILNSSTMCAMRVYELLAQGELVLTNRSPAMKNLFSGLIYDYDHLIDGSLFDTNEIKIVEKRIAGIRRIYDSSTVFERLEAIFKIISISCDIDSSRRIVLLKRQGNNSRMNVVELSSDAEITNKSEASDSRCLEGVDYVVPYTSVFESNRSSLKDAIFAFKYTDVPYVGFRNTNSLEGIKGTYQYVDDCKPEDSILWDANHYKSITTLGLGEKSQEKGFSVGGIK